jgi:hypothetical protein
MSEWEEKTWKTMWPGEVNMIEDDHPEFLGNVMTGGV